MIERQTATQNHLTILAIFHLGEILKSICKFLRTMLLTTKHIVTLFNYISNQTDILYETIYDTIEI